MIIRWASFGKSTSKSLHIGSFGVSLVAVGAMLLAFALALANFAKLVSLDPGSRYLYSHAWQMVRVGSLDINFSFAMDKQKLKMTSNTDAMIASVAMPREYTSRLPR